MMRKFSVTVLAALLVTACSGEAPENTTVVSNSGFWNGEKPKEETFNQRVGRQQRYLPAIKRYQLPAPDGDAVKVAAASIKANRDPSQPACGKVTSAERFDSDGSIVAKCSSGRDYRVLKIQTLVDTVTLDCVAVREKMMIDACDAAAIRSGKDESVSSVLSAMARMR